MNLFEKLIYVYRFFYIKEVQTLNSTNMSKLYKSLFYTVQYCPICLKQICGNTCVTFLTHNFSYFMEKTYLVKHIGQTS